MLIETKIKTSPTVSAAGLKPSNGRIMLEGF
jgi:hypothetical protein